MILTALVSLFAGLTFFGHGSDVNSHRIIRHPKPTPINNPQPPTSNPTTPPQSPTTPSTNDIQAYIMKGINDYRSSQGLSSVQIDKYTCDFAKVRAQEIVNNFNHDGFNNRVSSKTLPYPSYHLITENIAMNSNYKNVVTAWINSSGHAANMRSDTPYVCVEFSGNYYAYEGWKP